MRVQVIISGKNDASVVNESDKSLSGLFARVLLSQYQSIVDIVLTDEKPDIVHLIGVPNTKLYDKAKELCRLEIPYVYSPLGASLPWNAKSKEMDSQTYSSDTLNYVLSNASAIHTCSQLEHDSIKKQKEDVVLSIIYNPIITSDIAEEEFANRMYKLYHSTIADFDANIRKRIKNRISSLSESCEQTCIIIQKIMYAEYLYKRGNIPQNILNDLAKTMMEADYDEDHMEELLNTQGLEVFTGRLEQIMLDQSILSEGFMPVSIVNDKTTDRIKEIITNYQ